MYILLKAIKNIIGLAEFGVTAFIAVGVKTFCQSRRNTQNRNNQNLKKRFYSKNNLIIFCKEESLKVQVEE